MGGQNGVDADGAIVSTDVADQAAQALDNTEVALRAAEATLADDVSWTVLLHVDADLRAA